MLLPARPSRIGVLVSGNATCHARSFHIGGRYSAETHKRFGSADVRRKIVAGWCLDSCWDLVNGNDVRGANSVSRVERSFVPLRAIRVFHVDYDVAALDVDELDRCGNNLPIMEAEDNSLILIWAKFFDRHALMLDASRPVPFPEMRLLMHDLPVLAFIWTVA